MTALLDRKVAAYGPLLRRERFDVLWTVGGQVGALDVARAYRYSAAARTFRVFDRAPRAVQAAMLRRATGGVSLLAPYIPAPSGLERNATATAVVNSVGLERIRRLEPVRRDALLELLRRQNVVAVRDRASSAYLTSAAIEHRLTPDAVHAISRLWPHRPDPRSDVAVFQASAAILRRLGHDAVARELVTSEHLRGLRLRLLPAGTATGHDSLDDYASLAARVRHLDRDRDAEVVRDRRPLVLAGHIRSARITISSSLHVRIVASAYGVPRISLAKRKPTVYARTWDAEMPFGVTLDGLDRAIGHALALRDDPRERARSADLSRLAHENLADLAGRVTPVAARR
jgi:hypothetical protein